MRNRKVLIAGLVATLAASGGVAFAADEPVGQAEREAARAAYLQGMLDRWDSNGNGELDADERAAAKAEGDAQRNRELVDRFDANGDGTLDVSESAAMNSGKP